MANTTNTLQNKGQESVKNLKTNVLDVSRELQQQLADIKRRAFSLSDAISKRKIEFAKVTEIEETDVAEAAADVPTLDTKTEQPVEPADQKETVKEQPVAVEKTETAPTAEPVKEEPPKTKVVTTVENGREVKTYTDDKGNVKVRKFLDLSASTAKRPGTPQNGTRKPDGSRVGQQRVDTRRNGAAAPLNNKDAQADSRRSGAQKPAQKRFASAPIVDIPQSGPQKSHGNKNKTKEHPEENGT